MTGAGKSYFLNVLAGDEDPSDGTFVVGTGSKSETKFFSESRVTLYGTNQKASLFDMPGLYDTEKQDNDHLDNLQLHMKTSTGGKYTAVLLVLNSTQRKTSEVDTVVNILRCFFVDDRIIPVFSKCGSSRRSRANAESMARSYVEDWNRNAIVFKDPVFVGEDRD